MECVEELTEAGETEDLVLSNFDKRGAAVHGYSYSDHDGRLDLFITSHTKSTEPYTIQKSNAFCSILYSLNIKCSNRQQISLFLHLENNNKMSLKRTD